MLPMKVFKDNDYLHYSESVKKEFNEKHLKKEKHSETYLPYEK